MGIINWVLVDIISAFFKALLIYVVPVLLFVLFIILLDVKSLLLRLYFDNICINSVLSRNSMINMIATMIIYWVRRHIAVPKSALLSLIFENEFRNHLFVNTSILLLYWNFSSRTIQRWGISNSIFLLLLLIFRFL